MEEYSEYKKPIEITIEQIYSMIKTGHMNLNEVKQTIKSKVLNKATTEEMPAITISLRV